MRHVFLPAPVTACPQGMGDTAAAARLVAPAGRALGLTAGVLCAASGAVDLAAVAMAADEHAGAAAGAQKEPGRRLRTPSGAAQGDSKNRILQGLTRLSNQILSASQRQTLEALTDAHALGCFE